MKYPYNGPVLPPRAVVPLSCDEPAIPGHDGVRCDDIRHVLEDTPAESLSIQSEPAPFVITEAETPTAELAL